MGLIIYILLGIISYWIFKLFKFYNKRKNYPPGPFPLPFVGNVFQLDRNSPQSSLAFWHKKYGSVYTFWIGGKPNIVINDVDLLKEYIVKKGEVFVGRPFNYALNLLNDGGGIALTDGGKLWKDQRRFALHTLRDFGLGKSAMEENVQGQIETLLDHIDVNSLGKDYIRDQDKSGRKAVLDPKGPLQSVIGNIILFVILGLKYGKNDPIVKKMIEAMELSQETIVSPVCQLMSIYPILGNLPLFNHFGKDRILDSKKVQEDWAEERIRDHKKEYSVDDEPTDYTQAFLKEMHRRDKNGEPRESFTEHQLVRAILDLYGAGMETTAVTLRWAILFLLHNPGVQEAVQKEIDSVIGAEAKPSMQHRNSMLYTSAVLTEVQRLGNILPINLQRETVADINIEGYNIAKGTAVIPQIASVHLDSDVFTNPLEFNPQRYLNSNGTKDKPENVIPFSLGKRQCLGESLARMELFLIFTSLLQKYTIKPVDANNLPKITGLFEFIYVPHEYECVFEKRS